MLARQSTETPTRRPASQTMNRMKSSGCTFLWGFCNRNVPSFFIFKASWYIVYGTNFGASLLRPFWSYDSYNFLWLNKFIYILSVPNCSNFSSVAFSVHIVHSQNHYRGKTIAVQGYSIMIHECGLWHLSGKHSITSFTDTVICCQKNALTIRGL